MSSQQRKRQQRVRHEVGETNKVSPALSNEQSRNQSNAQIPKGSSRAKDNDRKSFQSKRTENDKGNMTNQTNVAVAKSQDYEPVTYMDQKPNPQPVDTFRKRPIEDRIPLKQREIVSNWHKFDDSALDEEIDLGEDYLMGEDFSEILKLGGSHGVHGGYLHLKGEASWGEISGSDGLGDLRVSDLAAAFATIPFHKLLKIHENNLPASTVSHYLKVAEENKNTYKFNSPATASVDDINSKIIQSLTLEEPLPLNTEGEKITCHKFITSSEKAKPVSAFSEYTNPRQGTNDTRPSDPPNFDFSLAKSIPETAHKISAMEQIDFKSCRNIEGDTLTANLSTNLTLHSALKETASSIVPSQTNNQPTNKTLPAVDAELEDWLDSMLDD